MQRHYITTEWKKRLPMFIAMLLLAVMVILTVTIPEPVTEPDAVYPMTNVHITWSESFHSGGFEE